MTDIHTHILPGVDDGSPSFSESLALIKRGIEQGIKNFVLTPHALSPYMRCKYKEEIIPIFNDFKNRIDKLSLGVNLYLGQEISYHRNIFEFFECDKLLSLNDSEYILFELPNTIKLSNLNAIIAKFAEYEKYLILAHIERYDYYSIRELRRLKNERIYFQVNASSFARNHTNYRRARRLLKLGLIDFIASDIHVNRAYRMAEAYKYVANTVGQAKAREIFVENPTTFLKINNKS